LPDQEEFVIIKITKIMPHGAYCKLTEYNIDAYLPISEVASGWIKNIHEFIKEGQQDVAKVIFVDREKKSVDVSLKKASSKQKKDKLNDYSIEKRSEGIFNKAVVASHKEEKKALLLTDISKVAKTYTELVNSIFEGKDPLADFKDKEFKQALYDLVSKTIKPKTYTVSYNIELSTSDTKAGIKTIKDALIQVEKIGVGVLYMGAPHYKLLSSASSYPKAEEKITAAQEVLNKYHSIEFSIKQNKEQA
ncbi:MAG: S1 RNA-binding domain-containing protein, partial [Candidatus Micrarchaeota archaeon]|nr:S1 RNA-binding domain-containing protein [Candidatus Micrarchaeota archaeon]